jgi:hypothetical protein
VQQTNTTNAHKNARKSFCGQKYFCRALSKQKARGPVQHWVGPDPHPQKATPESLNDAAPIAVKQNLQFCQPNKQTQRTPGVGGGGLHRRLCLHHLPDEDFV